MNKIINYPFKIFILFFENFGKYIFLLSKIFKRIDSKKIFFDNVLNQMIILGSKSVPIVILTSLFTGMVSSVQAAYQMESSLVPIWYIGSLVGETVLFELAPVITNGPPGITGFAGGRPKSQPIVAYWPALIPKKLIKTKVSLITTYTTK